MSAVSSIVVTGDIVLDRHIYEGERATFGNDSAQGARMVEEVGGAAVTCRLIAAVLKADLEARWQQELKKWEKEVDNARKQRKREPAKPQRPVLPECVLARKLRTGIGSQWPERLIGYASWAPFSRENSKERVWLVSKEFGYGPSEDPFKNPTDEAPFYERADDLPRNPQLLVIDDAGDRFRLKEHHTLWHLPASKTKNGKLPAWIVLKLDGAIGRGDLWDSLTTREDLRRKLVLITSARLLRESNARLSRGLSWERTVEHLLESLNANAAIAPLRQARHLIVTFETDGAVWIDFKNPKAPITRLVFDSENAEGEWGSRLKGNSFGYSTCLTAAVVQVLVNAPEKPDFLPAMERGLSAMRNLREIGHGTISEKGDFHTGQGFPSERLAGEILHPSHRFVRAEVPWTNGKGKGKSETPGSWSILASLQNPTKPPRPLYGFARQLVIRGPSVLGHVPHFRVGELLTAGRDEMENLRSLRRIIRAYRDRSSGKMPLSIGVFGAPGAGKSFGIKQLAIGMFGEPGADSYKGWMEFNLSQFDQPSDLIGAFHQVRDRVLQGLVPVAFWDEFDSREYHWLQYLLAPMQDGRFQQGQITHTLGRCVFVFAGATAETFEEFGPKKNDTDDVKRHFILSKGPDFKSRLDGYLNVLGPNQRTLPDSEDPKVRNKDDSDIFFPVRRALIIRNGLGCKKERLEFDPGLLTALLEIEDYRHGARSLTKILEPFRAVREQTGEPSRRSHVPAPNQLSLHLNDVDGFHTLCARDLPFKTDEKIQELAPAIHESWREIARKEGWTPRYNVPYKELPPDIKRSNEEAARRIPDVIALVGLKLVSADVDSAAEEKLIREHLNRHLEALAEEEHEGWMAHLQSEGWKFSSTRDDDRRLHDCLRPFHELRELDKDKDRESVRHYPDFVKRAGFKIVFIGKTWAAE